MCCIRLDYPLKLPIGVLAAATMTTSFILLCDELENVLNETLPKEAMSASHEIVFTVSTVTTHSFDMFFAQLTLTKQKSGRFKFALLSSELRSVRTAQR